MEQTYTIKLNSCESKPCVNAELKEVPRDKLQKAMEMAVKAFRNVEVTADQTGEVVLSYYVDYDWHLPIFNYGELIDILCHICYDK